MDGYGDYVELPPHVYDDLTEATVEARVRWDDFGYSSRWFHYGRYMGLNHRGETRELQFCIYDALDAGALRLASVNTDPPVGVWPHVAVVSGPGGMTLYLNGVLAAEHPFTGSLDNSAGPEFYLGRSAWVDNRYFHGQLDEVRVWSCARSQAQIRETMYESPAGDLRLVGHWTFDSRDARDVGGQGHDGVRFGDATKVKAELPRSMHELVPMVLLYGHLFDVAGNPPVGGSEEVWGDSVRALLVGAAADGGPPGPLRARPVRDHGQGRARGRAIDIPECHHGHLRAPARPARCRMCKSSVSKA